MSLKIERGLFKFDFTDHHAVLGVPVDASAKDIRKRYLQIARCLHPDSCAAESEADKQKASQFLSKLVNPAYEKIAQERNRAEYILLLTQMGKRLVQDSATVELNSELAKQLAQTPNVDVSYKNLIHKLAEKQYDSLDQVLQTIAQISELNLVYLMRKGGKAVQSPAPAASTSPNASAGKTARAQPAPPPPAQQESVMAQYLRRAEALVNKNNLAQARVELQDALKLEPNNCQCHTLMGVVYLRQNQTTMAKVHINKALQLNPKDERAIKAKKYLDDLAPKAGGQPTTPPPRSNDRGTSPTKPSDKSGGGLFGGLFGGKK